jgi:hypothetical protein
MAHRRWTPPRIDRQVPPPRPQFLQTYTMEPVTSGDTQQMIIQCRMQ